MGGHKPLCVHRVVKICCVKEVAIGAAQLHLLLMQNLPVFVVKTLKFFVGRLLRGPLGRCARVVARLCAQPCGRKDGTGCVVPSFFVLMKRLEKERGRSKRLGKEGEMDRGYRG